MTDIINEVISAVGDAGTAIVSRLGLSPFSAWQNLLDNQLLRWLNWFIPIGEMIVFAELWLVAIGLWYLISIALRWIKAIE